MRIIFFSVLIFPFISQAQFVTDSSRNKTFLYKDFKDGYVLMKSGVVEEAPLNYNSEDQSIYFIKDGKKMLLTGLEEIDTIYLHNKKFVPVKSNVFEVITDSTGTFVFISYSNKIKPLVATADQGGSAKKSSNQVSNTVTSVYVNGVKQNYVAVEIGKHYWIIRKKKMYKADNITQVKKILPERSKEIEKFITDNAISFVSDADLLKLADFINNLMPQ
jgi:hypothetical protein